MLGMTVAWLEEFSWKAGSERNEESGRDDVEKSGEEELKREEMVVEVMAEIGLGVVPFLDPRTKGNDGSFRGFGVVSGLVIVALVKLSGALRFSAGVDKVRLKISTEVEEEV